MDAKSNEPKHIGVLMRGSTGKLYVLRDDDEAPKPYNEEFVRSLMPLLPEQQKEQTVIFPVPPGVLEALEDAGYWPDWCWVFCSAARLR